MKIQLALILITAASLGVSAEKAPKLNLPPGEVAEACTIDVKTHCGNEEKAQVQKCLHDHDKDLTPPCAAHLKEKKAKADLKGSSPIDRAGAMFNPSGAN